MICICIGFQNLRSFKGNGEVNELHDCKKYLEMPSSFTPFSASIYSNQGCGARAGCFAWNRSSVENLVGAVAI